MDSIIDSEDEPDEGEPDGGRIFPEDEGMTKVDVGGRPKKEQIEGNLRVSFL